MSNLEEEIGKLYAKTAGTRYEFLRSEVLACRTALEVADYQLSVGNRATAESEVVFVSRGIATLRRFLPLTSEEHQLEIGKKAAELEAALDSVKARLNQGGR